MDELSHLCGSEGYGACEDAISISPFAIPLKRPKGLRPFWISDGAACSFLLSTKGSTVYVGCAEMHSTKASTVYAGYARRRVARATDAERRLLARGEVAFAKQMTEGGLRRHPLSRRFTAPAPP